MEVIKICVYKNHINGISNVDRYNDLFTHSPIFEGEKRKWIAILLLAILCTDSHSFYSLEYSQVSGVTSVCFFLIDTLLPRIYYANGKVASEHYVHTLLDTFFQNYIKRIKLFLKIPFMNDLKYFPRPLTFRINVSKFLQQY